MPVQRRKDARLIVSRWVLAKKRDEFGQGIRYKARLVARGFRQKFDVALLEPYSSVANMNAIRVFQAVALKNGCVTEQLDADTAFLNSDLKEEVYMEVLQGIGNAKKRMCKLSKAKYCLRQDASL